MSVPTHYRQDVLLFTLLGFVVGVSIGSGIWPFAFLRWLGY